MATDKHRKLHRKQVVLEFVALAVVGVSLIAILLSAGSSDPASEVQIPNETTEQARVRNYGEDIATADESTLRDIREELETAIAQETDTEQLRELNQLKIETCVALGDTACVEEFIAGLDTEEASLKQSYQEQLAGIYAAQGNSDAARGLYQEIIDTLEAQENSDLDESISYFKELQEQL